MKRYAFMLITFFLCQAATAQVSKEEQKLVDQANQLFEDGSFLEAHPLFSQLVSLHPKDADYNFKFGACALYAGEERQLAVKHLEFATSRTGVDNEAWYFLGKAHHLNYDFKKAIDAFEKFQRKADPKVKEKHDAARAIEMCQFGNTLLSQIQDLVVLEKTETSENDFFRYFGLDAIGGKMLIAPDELRSKLDEKKDHLSVMHFPKGAVTIYFSSYGKNGSNGKDLYRANILPDGKYGDVEPVPGYVNTPYDEDFAFMHPDGKTLYFASKGHNSMGGYDVFKSVYDVYTDTFQPPQNLDFAINTPDDDLFYVADSLNKEAYFASARSSVQGNLHVYKVMVTGIPVVNIFVQGDFLSEIDPSQTNARIIVTDELTGRPIADVRTDSYGGNYLITFPKPGLYKFEVEAENSPLVHEGMVEIPIFETSVALAQELRLVKEDGIEKLIINNLFDKTLDVDIASLSKEVLQAKANLDVNVTEELLAQVEDQEVTLTIEKDIANAPMAAGYAEGITVDQVLDEAQSDVMEMRQLVVDINERVDLAYILADKKHAEAAAKTSRAQMLMEGADPEDEAAYIEKLRESNELIKQASRLNHEAKVAVYTAEASVEHASIKQQEADEIQANVDVIQASADNGSFDAAVTAMRWEKSRQMELADTDSPKTRALDEAKLKEDDEQRVLALVSSLRDDEKSAQTDINRITRALENAKKKNDISRFEAELEDANTRLQIIGEDIKRKNKQALALGDEETFLLDQAEFYDLLINKDNSFGLTDNEIRTMGNGEKQELLASLESTQLRIDVLTIDDPETLALIGEETKWTRNEIAQISAVQARAIDLGIELIPAAELETEYSDLTLAINSADESTNNYRKKILLTQAVEKAQVQLDILKDVRNDLTDVREIEIIDQEITALESLDVDWNNQMEAMPSVVASVDPGVDARDIYLEVNPEYNSQLLNINNAGLSELEKSIQVLDVKRQTRMTLLDEITENNAVIMVNDNTAEVASLIDQNEKYNAAIDALNEEINDVNWVRAAYETENKSIIESDDAIVAKLQEQIQLTEEYLAMLDQVRVATEREKTQASDEEQLKLVIAMLDALNKEYDTAQQKLETYRSDLELTLAAEPEPTTSTDTSTADVSSTDADSSSETDTSTDATTDDAVAEVILTEIPENEGDIILNVAPDYQSDWAGIPALYGTTEGRSAAKIELNESLVEAIDQEIELRVTAIEGESDESVLDMHQLSIQRLSDLKELKLQEINNLRAPVEVELTSVDATESAPAVDIDIAEADLPEVENVVLLPIFERTPAMDPKSAYESDLYQDLLDENLDLELAVDNEDKIIEIKLEIAELEAQLDGPQNSKARSLDRQIEKQYQKLADEEVENARKIGALADVRYQQNQDDIDRIHGQKEAKLNSHEQLLEEYEFLLNKAQSEKEEAESVRQMAGPEMDEIKQNYLYREAFTYEANAIGYQQKALELLENLDVLMARDADELASIIDGTWVDPDAIVETSDDTAEVADSTTDTTADATVINETDDTEGSDTNETAETIDSTPDVEVEETAPVIELKSTRSVALAEVVNRRQMQEMLEEDHGLTEDELNAMLDKAEYANYLALAERVGEKESERALAIQERNALAMETISIQEDLDALELTISQTSDEAELAGLKEERKRLRASATVNYRRLEEMDADIDTSEDELQAMMNEAASEFASLSIEEDVEELASTSDVVDTAAVDPETAEETTSSPEVSPSTSTASAPRDFASFVFPNTLEEEIFAILDNPVHSASNPIPVDVTLPEGLVYKVQVGAFRNAIPQDHFDRFAPVSGESLNNGITRYTVGLFKQFVSADDAKGQVREMGYSDAFVVAFFNGERIPLYEARSISGEESATPIAATTTTSDDTVTNGSSDSSTDTTNEVDNTGSNSSTTSTDSADNSSDVSSDTSSETLPAIPVNTDVTADDVAYYENYPNAAKANQIEVLSGLFFTVQIGVYSKPVSTQELYNVAPLNSERLNNGQIRYSTGVYNSMVDASLRKTDIQSTGIQDAFVTAYYNGKRITVREANQYLLESGSEILDVTNQLDDEPVSEAVVREYDVFIGRFRDEVPAETAKAMLFLESVHGVQQMESAGETIYFTRKVSSESTVRQMFEDFESYDVTTLRIRAFEDGVEVEFIPSND